MPPGPFAQPREDEDREERSFGHAVEGRRSDGLGSTAKGPDRGAGPTSPLRRGACPDGRLCGRRGGGRLLLIACATWWGGWEREIASTRSFSQSHDGRSGVPS